MKLALISLLAVLVANVAALPLVSDTELDIHFDQFKANFGRIYSSAQEESSRKQIFASNLDFIFAHNLEAIQGKRSFHLAVNNFTDLTIDEFQAFYSGFSSNGAKISGKNFKKQHEPSQESSALPEEVDWVSAGAVSSVKDQGKCKASWAFSAVASIEGQTFLRLKAGLPKVSVQQLVDCSVAQGNAGCEGGNVDNAFYSILILNGLDSSSSYPYTGQTQTCTFNPSNVISKLGCYIDFAVGSEYNLQDGIANVGPISVAIDSSHRSFQFYSSGVYDEPQCSNTTVSHSMAVVGYSTTQNGIDFYNVKNSWGVGWGEKGYIRMLRNRDNQCGIATRASYPCVMEPF